MERGRRGVAACAAVAVGCGAVGAGLVHAVLAVTADRQHLSVGGIDPGVLEAGAWGGGAALAAFLLVCAVLLGRVALRDRAPGRGARRTLVVCGVVHCALGAVTLALTDVVVPLGLLVAFTLVVLTLTLYPPAVAPAPSGPQVGDGDAEPVAQEAPEQGQ
ncbi:hypothetical protein [Streptomyces sp. RFCAC02]|uniref:hypothetical protein n=1 Tax=Streptomyces sp. RFCAC02 TaxID=2499143 RepID=UPI00102023AA|nr:hypothetical protein [Streptomyces sp. RFCAC02]